MQSVIHLVDYPLLPNDDSITASFPSISIRSNTGNEEEEDHDHDHEGDDHDHGNEPSGEASGSVDYKFTMCIVVASVLSLSMLL